ncbi:YggT family protein [Candidatus Poribacteria bacterium]|nr:YggT family protein [Candidatus Poribacteria bacterium]MYB00035.1 YggT family protein [Candidatus Poribacteria bacterium]
MPIHNLARFIARLLEIYTFVVLVNALLSWFVFGTQNAVIRQIYWFTSRIVDPVLNPIRNALQSTSQNFGIDISPFILIILLQILARILW